jgi:hypothetical protein
MNMLFIVILHVVQHSVMIGYDVCVANNANTTMDSSSYLGQTYSHPQYAYGTNEAQSFLAGSFEFQLDEIEVYQKE